MSEYFVYAVLGSCAYAISGYFKNLKKKREKFDFYKFSKTAVIGIAVGIVMEFSNLNQNAALSFLESAGITAMIDNILKGIFRFLKKKKIKIFA